MRPKVTRKEKHIEWEKRLLEFRKSGLNPVEFCRKTRISISVFRYWMRKIQDMPATTDISFVEVPTKVQSLPVHRAGGYEITFQSGI